MSKNTEEWRDARADVLARRRAAKQQAVEAAQTGYCPTCHCLRTPHDCAEPYAGQPGICCVCGSELERDGKAIDRMIGAIGEDGE